MFNSASRSHASRSGLRDYGIVISEADLKSVMRRCDRDAGGTCRRAVASCSYFTFASRPYLLSCVFGEKPYGVTTGGGARCCARGWRRNTKQTFFRSLDELERELRGEISGGRKMIVSGAFSAAFGSHLAFHGGDKVRGGRRRPPPFPRARVRTPRRNLWDSSERAAKPRRLSSNALVWRARGRRWLLLGVVKSRGSRAAARDGREPSGRHHTRFAFKPSGCPRARRAVAIVSRRCRSRSSRASSARTATRACATGRFESTRQALLRRHRHHYAPFARGETQRGSSATCIKRTTTRNRSSSVQRATLQ